jgi:hypothetical protein
MRTVIPNDIQGSECFVLEIDGKVQSQYEIFTEALKAGFELKQKFPHSKIKVHDINQ